jgi:hypothetical protein
MVAPAGPAPTMIKSQSKSVTTQKYKLRHSGFAVFI